MNNEPMSDERLAIIRRGAQALDEHVAKGGAINWAEGVVPELLAEVDRLRDALAKVERARDEAWDGEWRTIPQTREQAEKALMTWTKKWLVQRLIHEQQASIQRQDRVVNLLMDQRDRLAHRAENAEAALARVTDLHNADGKRWVGFPRADREEAYCTVDQEAAPCATIRAIEGDDRG